MSKYLKQFAQQSDKSTGEEIASQLLQAVQQEREKNLKKYAELEGEVMAHSMAATVLRYKEASARGLCWECGQRVPSSMSVYRRCKVCEDRDE